MNNRRRFLFRMAACASAPAFLATRVFAADAPGKLEEADPVAIALGYKEDTTKVDAARFPNHKPDQRCDGCALYTGKAGAATGPCTAVGGKLVTAAGWCAAFVVKPAPGS
jgi:hypothetical protein